MVGGVRAGGDQRPGVNGRAAPARRRGGAGLASERREHLVRLAADLFAKKGFQATTVREIADEAGILSGSLYHHFDSKESIVDEVLSSFLDDLLAGYRAIVGRGEGPRETVERLMVAAFETLEPHRAAITVMQNDWNYLTQFPRFGYLAAVEAEVEKLWVDQIERGQLLGEFRADVDAKLTYRLVRDTIWVAVRWFRPRGRLTCAQLARHYVSVLFDGIGRGERRAGAAARADSRTPVRAAAGP